MPVLMPLDGPAALLLAFCRGANSPRDMRPGRAVAVRPDNVPIRARSGDDDRHGGDRRRLSPAHAGLGGCSAKLVGPTAETTRWQRGVPQSRRNRRRAYDQDGCEIEPPRLASMLPPAGTGRVVARCSRNGCGHQAEVDVTSFMPEVYVPDIGLKLRCAQCGCRGAWIFPIHLPIRPNGEW